MFNTQKTWLARLAVVGFALSGPLMHTVQAADLLADGEFKVGMEITYPPFESYEGDKVVGFDPEVSALLAEQINAQPKFIDNKFTGLILGLASQKFDAVISGMYVTPDRLKKADAIPYARTGASIMVVKGSQFQPKTEQELCGLSVGLQQGTTWVKALNELSSSYCEANSKPLIKVHEFPSAPEVSQALLSKNVDAQLEIAGAAKMFVERTKGRIEISSPDLVYPQTLGIYVKQGNSQLKQALESALATITANGSFPALLEKYDLSPAQ
ncbi:transporter substrate-binding domain-containing protein [Agarivorans sp. QJM3NY_33]|uniref:transporter substrate-binding domain-containing protein n=1 Tax=Agarivorans sp. QJM3NY_33 TaxID=3421432 RepID=UPI003D7D2381